jgi:hypothetical protein
MTDVMTRVAPQKGSGPTDIRPFRVKFSDAELKELRRTFRSLR